MIPNQIVEIKVTSRKLLNYYHKKGYSFKDELPNKINIHLRDLPKGSSIKVNFLCDECGRLGKTFYFTLTTKEKHLCRSCSRKGIEPPNKIHLSYSKLNFIEECYSDEWMAPREIGKYIGYSEPVISNALKTLGYSVKRRGKKPNLVCPICKIQFKKIPSEIGEVNCCSKKCRGIYTRKRIDLICLNCTKTFKVKPHQDNRKFCSLDCAYEYSKKGIAIACQICGKRIWSTPSCPKFFCSKKCFGEANKTGKILECAYCGSPRYIPKSHLRNELYFCSHKCSIKYRQIDEKYYSKILDKSRKSHLRKWKEDVEWASQRRIKAFLSAIKLLKRFNKGPTKIEQKVYSLLKELNINFVPQKEINSTNYSVRKIYDIYLPKPDIFIEVHGGFWHSDPRFYPNTERLKPIQKKNLINDRIKIDIIVNELKKKLYILWEHDILTNIDEVKIKLLKWNNN